VNAISAINFFFRNDRENSKSFRFKRWRGTKAAEKARGGGKGRERERERERVMNYA